MNHPETMLRLARERQDALAKEAQQDRLARREHHGPAPGEARAVLRPRPALDPFPSCRRVTGSSTRVATRRHPSRTMTRARWHAGTGEGRHARPGQGQPQDVVARRRDDDTNGAVSATYRVGALEEILRVLEEHDFNVRSAGGGKIELGGEFGFAVGRDGDKDHEQATEAAVAALKGEGFEAHVVDVQDP